MIVLSVLGNLSLALVTATMSFRIYKSVLTAVNKTQDGHPFKVRMMNLSIKFLHFKTFGWKNNSANWLLSKCSESLEDVLKV